MLAYQDRIPLLHGRSSVNSTSIAAGTMLGVSSDRENAGRDLLYSGCRKPIASKKVSLTWIWLIQMWFRGRNFHRSNQAKIVYRIWIPFAWTMPSFVTVYVQLQVHARGCVTHVVMYNQGLWHSVLNPSRSFKFLEAKIQQSFGIMIDPWSRPREGVHRRMRRSRSGLTRWFDLG